MGHITNGNVNIKIEVYPPRKCTSSDEILEAAKAIVRAKLNTHNVRMVASSMLADAVNAGMSEDAIRLAYAVRILDGKEEV